MNGEALSATASIAGEKTNEEKEIIAEKLFNAIKDKETSEEMLEAAKALKL